MFEGSGWKRCYGCIVWERGCRGRGMWRRRLIVLVVEVEVVGMVAAASWSLIDAFLTKLDPSWSSYDTSMISLPHFEYLKQVIFKLCSPLCKAIIKVSFKIQDHVQKSMLSSHSLFNPLTSMSLHLRLKEPFRALTSGLCYLTVPRGLLIRAAIIPWRKQTRLE